MISGTETNPWVLLHQAKFNNNFDGKVANSYYHHAAIITYSTLPTVT